jgi:AraC-like DNA-binding protein
MGRIYLEHYDSNDVFDSNRLSRGFVESDYSIGIHTQGFYEVNIVLRGEALHRIGEQKIKVSLGDTFIIPPNVPHAYDGGEGFDVYHLILSPVFLERYSATLSLMPAYFSLFHIDPLIREKMTADLHFLLDADQIASLLPTLRSLSAKEGKNTPVESVTSDAEALIIIAALCSIYEQKTQTNAPATEDTAFSDSLSYLYAHYNSTVTVDTLCRISGMSRTAYLAKFKRVTGSTPSAVQSTYRVEMAKRLLTQTNAPVSEISLTVGYYDTSHLVRIFKKQTGLTPSEYRKSKG